MIWRNSYVKGTQDTMFKRKTKKTVSNEGAKGIWLNELPSILWEL